MLPYLNSSFFFVLSEVHSIHSIRQNEALHPLVRVLSALRTNSPDAVDFLEIHLQPLLAVTMTNAPGPAMVQPSVPRSQVMVVIR